MAAKKNGFQSGMTFGKKDATPRRQKKAAKKASEVQPQKADRSKMKSVPLSKAPAEPTGMLSELLQKAADMFVSVPSEKKLLFTLGYKKGMWQFEVVNSWQVWFEKSLQSEFRAPTPEASVAAFLSYVESRELKPAELTTPD